MGTLAYLPEAEPGKPRRPATGEREGGASVVVRARENRVHGEAGQRDDTPLKSEERTVDTDHHTDRVWVLSVQRRLYQWSQGEPLTTPNLLESRMHNERCTSGSVRGHVETDDGNVARRPCSTQPVVPPRRLVNPVYALTAFGGRKRLGRQTGELNVGQKK